MGYPIWVEKEAVRAVELMKKPSVSRKRRVPKSVQGRVSEILLGNYAFMDSPVFKQRNIERQLFTFDEEPKLPLTSWYQPTREDLENQKLTTPQLMSTAEERLMFLRFNFAKKKLQQLDKKVKQQGLTAELADLVI